MVGGLTLILGGARSGKSSFAEDLAQESGRSVVYLATATPDDDEMRQRIATHRASRPRNWRTLEEPLDLPSALSLMGPGDLALLECVTLWVSNLLLAGPSDESPADALGRIVAETERLLSALRDKDIWVIAVSNEVGMGIVPGSEMVRSYRDALGRVNQLLAGQAGSVYLTVAGLPLALKGTLPPEGLTIS